MEPFRTKEFLLWIASGGQAVCSKVIACGCTAPLLTPRSGSPPALKVCSTAAVSTASIL